MKPETFKTFIRELSDAAEEIIRPLFADPALPVEEKADRTLVTKADRDAEVVMREMIEKRFPRHSVLGEEFGESNPGSDFQWVLDPIDGTKSFVAGVPMFGTLIALLHEGRPMLGVINNPITRQFLLGDNTTTTLNGTPVRVMNPRPWDERYLCTTHPKNPGRFKNGENWNRLWSLCKELYTWGDCYGYHLVATGGSDIMCDPKMMPWDLLALIPVMRGAGAAITDWEGNDPVVGNSIVTAHPEVHAEVIEILNA